MYRKHHRKTEGSFRRNVYRPRCPVVAAVGDRGPPDPWLLVATALCRRAASELQGSRHLVRHNFSDGGCLESFSGFSVHLFSLLLPTAPCPAQFIVPR